MILLKVLQDWIDMPESPTKSKGRALLVIGVLFVLLFFMSTAITAFITLVSGLIKIGILVLIVSLFIGYVLDKDDSGD